MTYYGSCRQGRESRVWMSKAIHVLSSASIWPSTSKGMEVDWGICPGAQYCPLTQPRSNCYLWKILPFLKSEHKFNHLGGWRWGNWASQMWSTAETANRLCLMCQSREHYSGHWEGFWSCFQTQREECWEQTTMSVLRSREAYPVFTIIGRSFNCHLA